MSVSAVCGAREGKKVGVPSHHLMYRSPALSAVPLKSTTGCVRTYVRQLRASIFSEIIDFLGQIIPRYVLLVDKRCTFPGRKHNTSLRKQSHRSSLPTLMITEHATEWRRRTATAAGRASQIPKLFLRRVSWSRSAPRLIFKATSLGTFIPQIRCIWMYNSGHSPASLLLESLDLGQVSARRVMLHGCPRES